MKTVHECYKDQCDYTAKAEKAAEDIIILEAKLATTNDEYLKKFYEICIESRRQSIEFWKNMALFSKGDIKHIREMNRQRMRLITIGLIINERTD